VSSPVATADGSFLDGVTATSATNAWAVGTNFTSSLVDDTLILHWNGKAWSRVTSPNPGGKSGTGLSGVAATSGSPGSWLPSPPDRQPRSFQRICPADTRRDPRVISPARCAVGASRSFYIPRK